MSNRKTYIRYLVLLLILLAITSQDLYNHLKVHFGDSPLSVIVIPINGDYSSVSNQYINSLITADVADIAAFLTKETSRYKVQNERRFTISLGQALPSLPPKLPPDTDNLLRNMYWSIAFRFWSIWSQFKYQDTDADIHLYVQFFDPQQFSRVDFSVGLQKGMIGLVNAYAHADYKGSNNVIIAHELLHILGAHDKYDPNSYLPLFPIGYAEPDRIPLHPQSKAEIMGGRIPLTPRSAEIPASLDHVIIGMETAAELRWIDPMIE